MPEIMIMQDYERSVEIDGVQHIEVMQHIEV